MNAMNPQSAGTHRPPPQSGQALVEFLAMAAALLGLFLLMPMIGKYQDIAHATQMASRYAAFDATVHNDAAGSYKQPDQLAAEVRRRYFSRLDAPIKTGDTAGDFDAHRNPLWTDPAGNPLIPRFSDISVSFGENQSTKHSQAFKASRDGEPFSKVPLANHVRIGLNAPGIYRANISVPLANLPAGIQSYTPFDQLDLRVTRHTSVLIEPSASSSVEQTMDRFGRLAPLNSLFSPVETLLDVAIPVFEMMEIPAPKFGRLDKWQDIVPEDRLRAE